MRDEITTERLTLRKPVLTDARVIARLLSNPDIARMTGSIPYPFFALSAEFWVMSKRSQWERGLSYAYAIIQNNELVGVLDIFINGDGDRELGYWVGEPYWGHGYITEAAKAVLDEGFDKLGAEYIDAGYFEDNPASGRVLEKLGFVSKNETSNLFSVARGVRFPGIELRLPRKTAMKAAIR